MNREAKEELFNDYCSDVLRFVTNRYRSHPSLDDIKQEALIGLWQAVNSQNNEKSKKFLVLAIFHVRGRINRWLKGNSINIFVEEEDVPEVPEYFDTIDVYSLLSSLDEFELQFIVDRFFNGYTYKEMCMMDYLTGFNNIEALRRAEKNILNKLRSMIT